MRRLGILAVLSLLGFLLLSKLAQRLLYYPVRYPEGMWQAQRLLGAEDVWLTAADSTRIHGWWVEAPEARFVTLHLHGNGGNITHRVAAAMGIRAAGSSVLLLDYRGYGRSEGSPSEAGLYQDADAAYTWVQARGTNLVIHGESLGTSVAVDLAVRKRCKGVVLEAPFTSIGAVAHRVVPFAGPLVMRGYNTLQKISGLKAPVLVIHGDKDEVIDFAMGKAIHEAAPPPKRFWRIPGAGHNDIHDTAGPEYSTRLREFYDSL